MEETGPDDVVGVKLCNLDGGADPEPVETGLYKAGEGLIVLEVVRGCAGEKRTALLALPEAGDGRAGVA